MMALIVARASNNIIGNKGQIPWHISSDLKYFKKLTTGHVVIMGRKTYESIGRPLPNRINIVVSTKMQCPDGVIVVPSFEMAILEAKKSYPDKDIYLIGGNSIYKNGACLVDKMFITEIGMEFEGDTKFVDFDKARWDMEVVEDHSDETIPYHFVIYTRR